MQSASAAFYNGCFEPAFVCFPCYFVVPPPLLLLLGFIHSFSSPLVVVVVVVGDSARLSRFSLLLPVSTSKDGKRPPPRGTRGTERRERGERERGRFHERRSLHDFCPPRLLARASKGSRVSVRKACFGGGRERCQGQRRRRGGASQRETDREGKAPPPFNRIPSLIKE